MSIINGGEAPPLTVYFVTSQLAVSKKSGTRPLFVLRDALLLLGDFRRGVGMNFELFLNAGRLS
jgi:hypothetical protein